MHPAHATLDCDPESADRMREGGLYSLTLIEGVDGSTSSPEPIRQKLERAGLNSVNAVVDITNLVMLEQGQPLHAFDADALEALTGKPLRPMILGSDWPARGSFTGLDGRDLELGERCQLVTCHDTPIALAGVMGGQASSVTASTRRIWLEAAMFSPASVRNTARAVGLRTDASARFEKGLPVDLTLPCSARASALLCDAFAAMEHGRWVCGDVPTDLKPVLLRRDALHRLLGPLATEQGPEKLNDQAIERSLTALGCQLTACHEGWQVLPPPSRRQDLYREVDLIEEVARLTGFDRFGVHLPAPLEPGALTAKQQAERKLRRLLCASGLRKSPRSPWSVPQIKILIALRSAILSSRKPVTYGPISGRNISRFVPAICKRHNPVVGF